MNSEHESFILHTKDLAEQIEDLDTNERAQLFTAIIYFVTEKPLPELSKAAKLVFTPIRNQLERDDKKWEEVRQKRSEAGKKGGRPPKSTAEETYNYEKQTKANAFYEKQTKAKKAVDEDVDVCVNVDVDEAEAIDKKKVSKNNKENNVYSQKSYSDIMDEFNVSPTVRERLIAFTKACYVNKHIVPNDKFEDIIIRLDLAYRTDEMAKCRCIDRAISGGYFDIKTDK